MEINNVGKLNGGNNNHNLNIMWPWLNATMAYINSQNKNNNSLLLTDVFYYVNYYRIHGGTRYVPIILWFSIFKWCTNLAIAQIEI